MRKTFLRHAKGPKFPRWGGPFASLLWGGSGMPVGWGAKSRKLPVYLWRQGKALLQGGPPRLENMAMGMVLAPKGKCFFFNPIKVLRTGEETFFEILRGQCLWALAHPAGWGVVEPGVLRPAEGTLLHAPRSVGQGGP